MGLQADAMSKSQAECEGLRTRLDDEQSQRISLEARLTRSERLLQEEHEASNVLEQYLEDALREGFETAAALELAREEGLGTAIALRSTREDYQELMADADRKVKALEMKAMEEKIMEKAGYLRREDELEEELDEVRFRLRQKEEELQHEHKIRADLAMEMETALGKSKDEVGPDFSNSSTLFK